MLEEYHENRIKNANVEMTGENPCMPSTNDNEIAGRFDELMEDAIIGQTFNKPGIHPG
jgi:hypothetical protein